MERSLTLQQPSSFRRQDVAGAADRLFSSLFAMVLGRRAREAVGAQPGPRPAPLARPPREEAWLSYAVYSGALSPRQYKSSRRLP